MASVTLSEAGLAALRNVKLTFGFYGTECFNDKVQGLLLKTLQANLKAKHLMLDFEPVTVDYNKQAIAMAAGNAADVSVTNVAAAWPLMYHGQLANLTEAPDGRIQVIALEDLVRVTSEAADRVASPPPRR